MKRLTTNWKWFKISVKIHLSSFSVGTDHRAESVRCPGPRCTSRPGEQSPFRRSCLEGQEAQLLAQKSPWTPVHLPFLPPSEEEWEGSI